MDEFINNEDKILINALYIRVLGERNQINPKNNYNPEEVKCILFFIKNIFHWEIKKTHIRFMYKHIEVYTRWLKSIFSIS